MALQQNLLYSETTRGPLKAVQPAEGPGAVDKVAFASGSGTLPVGTPVYMSVSTGLYAKCVTDAALGATNDIYGIVWPADITLNASGEILGTIMTRGAVDFAELEALRAASVLAGTLQQLKDVCRKPSNRTRGIHIENIDKIGTTTTGLA